MSTRDKSAPRARLLVRSRDFPANVPDVEEKLAQLWPPDGPGGDEPCPECGQELEYGQLVTSDFKRHISCPQVPAFRTAA